MDRAALKAMLNDEVGTGALERVGTSPNVSTSGSAHKNAESIAIRPRSTLRISFNGRTSDCLSDSRGSIPLIRAILIKE